MCSTPVSGGVTAGPVPLAVGREGHQDLQRVQARPVDLVGAGEPRHHLVDGLGHGRQQADAGHLAQVAGQGIPWAPDSSRASQTSWGWSHSVGTISRVRP